ncbi:MAG: SRPBCC family protein [Bradymonadaceae bacterium]
MAKNGAETQGGDGRLSGPRRFVRRVGRLVPTMGGSALIIYGLSRRSRGGIGLAMLGGGIVLRQIRQNLRLLGEVPMLRIEESIIVSRPIEEVYQYWREFENFPSFMANVEVVRSLERGRSFWMASVPGTNQTFSWEAQLTEERPNERLRWRSVEDADIYNEGEVFFRRLPNGGGTEVFVRMAYEPPTGKLGRGVMRFLNAVPATFVRDDLERLKRLLETGAGHQASVDT